MVKVEYIFWSILDEGLWNIYTFAVIQEILLGDCTKAKTQLNWKKSYTFDVSCLKIEFLIFCGQTHDHGAFI